VSERPDLPQGRVRQGWLPDRPNPRPLVPPPGDVARMGGRGAQLPALPVAAGLGLPRQAQRRRSTTRVWPSGSVLWSWTRLRIEPQVSHQFTSCITRFSTRQPLLLYANDPNGSDRARRRWAW